MATMDEIANGLIIKSFIPGKGWVKAAELTKPGKRALSEHVAYTGRVRGNRGMHPEAYAAKYRQAKGRKIHPGFKTTMNRKVTVNRKPTMESLEEPGLAGYARPNGRGGGTVKVFPHNMDPEQTAITIKHETAHITPKRNIHTFHRRINSSTRIQGREEGRADYIAHGGKSKGAYAEDDPGFNRGYNEVQRKMHAAAQRKAKMPTQKQRNQQLKLKTTP